MVGMDKDSSSVTWFNGFCDGRGKRGAIWQKKQGPMIEKYHYNKKCMIFFLREGGGGKRR
jgi:hypothetical protein